MKWVITLVEDIGESQTGSTKSGSELSVILGSQKLNIKSDWEIANKTGVHTYFEET